jgi:prepilin-type N-terminal cleavage/methylation domain-containing protein
MWATDRIRLRVGDRIRLRAGDPSHLRLRAEAGFTLIETTVALAVLAVGILGAVTAFNSARTLSLISERHTAMEEIAQREIERIEGLPYVDIGLASTPTTSTDPTNPDHYVVAGPPPLLEWDRVSLATEQLDVDATNGTVPPLQTWSQVTQGGNLNGDIYDYVTWSTDSKCSPGCPVSQDYKRIVVAVTMTSGIQPNPVYVSSVVADPTAAPTGGTVNGTSGNPLTDPTTKCANSAGQTVSCTQGLDQGIANTYFLHDWPSSGGMPQTPSVDNALHDTSGLVTGQVCTTSTTLATIASDTTGCPVPDLMDGNPPTGTLSQPPNFSTDLCADTCYHGGRDLLPTCEGSACPTGSNPGTTCTTTSCGGTDSTSDCNDGGWASTLQNQSSEFWVSSPLGAGTTFTGAGGISLFTQTVNSATAGLVTFCVEIYDVPPSGSATTLTDILAWPPVAIGGAAYVAATDPSTGSNWPSAASQLSFVFTYSQQPVTIAAGHRVGVRVWFKESLGTSIDLLYDNPNYVSQVQLNSES